MNTLIKDGREKELTISEIELLTREGIIYLCSCNHCGFYHTNPGYNWEDIYKILESEDYKTQKRIGD